MVGRKISVVVVVAALAAACSGSPTAAPTTTTAPAPTTTMPAPDGTLRLGLLLPTTGPGANLGASLNAGAELAIAQINAAGGVLGHSVVPVVQDEGSSAASAAASLDKLITSNVDAIVGPASSRVALEILSRAVRAHVAVCSPTTTAADLTRFPDNGLFLRTIPSDALQAVALTKLVEGTGSTKATIVVPDDSYGDGYAAALQTAAPAHNVGLLATVRYAASDRPSSVAESAVNPGPQAIVVIGSGDTGAAVLDAIHAIAPKRTSVFVNDAMKSPSVVAALGQKAGETLSGVRGTAPRAEPSQTAFRDAFAAAAPGVSDDFAAFAYDCVNVLAISAVAAGTDQASALVGAAQGVTNSGDQCSTFAACRDQLVAGRNIDLVGASGFLDLDSNGDVVSADFDTFTFDDNAVPVSGPTVAAP